MSFNKEKLLLVNYFLKKEKYFFYKSKLRDNNIYLYKVNNKEFQIIKIIDNFSGQFNDFVVDDYIMQSLKEFLNKKFQLEKLKILSIVLVENCLQVYKENDNNIILFVNKKNYIDLISKYYPKIVMLQKNNLIDKTIIGISKEEILSYIKNPNSNLTKKLNKLGDKLNPNNLSVTWILITLLLVIPIIGIFFGSQIFDTQEMTQETVQLIYGNITRDLLIWNNQWWRLWTYVLFSSSPLLVILNLFMIFVVSRYVEAIFGPWRLSFILIFGVPLVGLFLVSVLPNLIFGGSTVLLAILWGSLFSYNYGKDDLESLITNQRTLIIIIWLLVMPIFLGYLFYLINFIGFFVGSAIGYALEFNCLHYINWTIIYSIFIILTIIIICIILLSWTKYVPPYNKAVIDTLLSYWQAGLINKYKIEEMLNNYYFFPQHNWPFLIRN